MKFDLAQRKYAGFSELDRTSQFRTFGTIPVANWNSSCMEDRTSDERERKRGTEREERRERVNDAAGGPVVAR